MAYAYDTRETAAAAWSTCKASLCGFSMLCGRYRPPRDRAAQRAMSMACSGLQCLMAASTSGVSGQTATWDHGGVHWVTLR